MPNTLIAVRACAGGHTVPNADVIGMTVHEGYVEVWCIDHAAMYDSALRQLGATALEM